ncbi:MAG: hypothetical protein GC150_02430 [Rhizobiales bacterium]|nr:hypothetical protein [Hyphomicrobiales bacterium]
MNKRELAAALAEKLNLSKEQAGNFLDAFLAVVTTQMQNGGEVKIAGFGNYKVKTKPARMVTPPGQGEARMIPASVVPKFTPAKALKDLLNGK